jgi:uncharacterized protein
MEFDTLTVGRLEARPDAPTRSENDAEALPDAPMNFLAAGPFFHSPDCTLRGLCLLRISPEESLPRFAQDPAVRAG